MIPQSLHFLFHIVRLHFDVKQEGGEDRVQGQMLSPTSAVEDAAEAQRSACFYIYCYYYYYYYSYYW